MFQHKYWDMYLHHCLPFKVEFLISFNLEYPIFTVYNSINKFFSLSFNTYIFYKGWKSL